MLPDVNRPRQSPALCQQLNLSLRTSQELGNVSLSHECLFGGCVLH
jgi:hypothetical protein